MPGSSTPPGRQALRYRAWLCCLPPSKQRRHPGYQDFEAQWLACALPYRRFVDALASGNARLGADVDRYLLHRIGTFTDYSLPVSRRTSSPLTPGMQSVSATCQSTIRIADEEPARHT